MPKGTKNEAMGKVYREFSRQKYNKYRAQFPRLRESEIVSKIIKEWDALDGGAKDHLQKIYERKNHLTIEDCSSSEALMKADLASKEARITAEKVAKKSIKPSFSATRFHSAVKPASSHGSDFNRGSEQKDDSRLDSSSPQLFVQKSKAITKLGKDDYVNFFKHHYKKLAKEHKRWSTQQISSVIKLLWKKNKGVKKTARKTHARLRSIKPISGKRFFRKTRNLQVSEAYGKWRRFPVETRKQWENKARNIWTSDNNSRKGTLKLNPDTNKVNNILLSH